VVGILLGYFGLKMISKLIFLLAMILMIGVFIVIQVVILTDSFISKIKSNGINRNSISSNSTSNGTGYYLILWILPKMMTSNQLKSKEEVQVIQKAIDITEVAFRRLLQFIQPGVKEYEIEAEIYHSFLSQRATGVAYHSIIASGDNARTLHYTSNNNVCKDGELILMDFGAEYGGYCADLTRTVPVNGKFTKRQKEVYNTCLHLHDYAKSILKPGISILNYTDKVGEEATQQFLKIGLLKKMEVKNEDPENRAYRKYLYHGISHHLGLDVHDLGTRTAPITAGMVFTIEPGIYIKEEGMGVRIENNFLITPNGNQDLMKNIPITVEEIESLMKRNKK
jgi:Xaa-Pro aminopeptidase